MPARFEFPLSYIESMMPRAAITNETVTAPMPDEPNSASALNELLASLENPTVPQPQQPERWQRIIGALGDALGAQAAVRAGGAPPQIGPFAANLRAQQMSYEQQRREAEMTGMETRNRVRVGAFEEEQRAKREKEVAGIRMRGQRLIKSEFTRDVAGEPHTFQRWQNPQTGEIVAVPDPETGEMVYERDLGVRGYAPFIQPAIPGEAPPQRIPRTGPPGPVGGNIPPPPVEVGERASRLGGFAQDLANFKKALPGFIKKRGGGKRIGQQIIRKTPMIGAQLSERVSKEGEIIAAARDAVMADFIRIMSGLQASEQEQARLQRILPDLGTVDAATALAKIDQFEQSVFAYARELAHQRPHLLTPELSKLLGLEGGATPEADPARDLFRDMFGRDPEEY